MIAPRILRTNDDYESALRLVDSLMDAEAGSPEESQLELWSLLVEHYEDSHFPIDYPDPIDAIRFRMEQEGLRQRDLVKYFPGKSRVSEILNRRRPLPLAAIRSLSKGLGIPAEVLIREPKLLIAVRRSKEKKRLSRNSK